MYLFYDKPSSIKEVQKMLYILFPERNIFPNGILSDKTNDAIIEFKRKFGLAESSRVDKEFRELLYSEYKRAKREETASINFPVHHRYYGRIMIDINKTMKDLLNYYGKHQSLLLIPYFSDESLLSVNKLQKIYNLPIKSYIDSEFYYRMIKDHSTLQTK